MTKTVHPQQAVVPRSRRSLCSVLCTLLVLLLVALFPVMTNAGAWKAYTSVTQFNAGVQYGDTLVIGSSGGLSWFLPGVGELHRMTNVEGLGGTRVNALDKDEQGRLWVLFSSRMLLRFDDGVPTRTQVLRTNAIEASCMAVGTEAVWLGTVDGVVLFQRAELPYSPLGDIRETYGNLGFSQGAVTRTIELHGDSVYVGTDQGLAIASSDFLHHNLLLPSSWNSFTSIQVATTHGDSLANLPGVNAVAFKGDSVLLGTDHGFYCLRNGIFTLIGVPDTFRIRTILVRPDTLWVGTASHCWTWTQNRWERQTVKGLWTHDNRLLFATSRGIFISSEYDGLVRKAPPAADSMCHFDGPLSSTPLDIAFGSDGAMWVACKNKGLSRFKDNVWTHFVAGHAPNGTPWDTLGLPDSRMNRISFGPDGSLYCAQWGGGAYRLAPDGLFYPVGESVFVPHSSGYTVVSDLWLEPNGREWYANYQATEPVSIFLHAEDSSWTTYPPTINDNDHKSVRCIMPTDSILWIGYTTLGVDRVNLRGTPKNPADDTRTSYDEPANDYEGLAGNDVRRILYDLKGEVWMATSGGVSHYNSWFDTMDNLYLGWPQNLSLSCWDLAIDGRNNKWVGTEEGLGVYSDEQYAWLDVLNVDNSGLIDNWINRIVVNPFTGDLCFATQGGVSCYSYRTGESAAEEVFSYPNPFRIDLAGTAHVTFQVPWQDATIRVYTVAGELVIEIPPAGYGAPTWNGRNTTNKLVASGVYIYLVTNAAGESRRAKMAIIR